MKVKLILSILLSLLLFGCSPFDQKTPPDVKLVNEVRKSTAKKLKEQKNLYLIGTGSQMMHEIEVLIMSFNYYKEVDLNSARKLIVDVINEFLLEINNKKEIRPYLCQYPFTSKNVEIRIWIFKPNRLSPDLDKIYYVSAINGVLTYYLDLPETYSREAICEETYDQAVQLVKNENKIDN